MLLFLSPRLPILPLTLCLLAGLAGCATDGGTELAQPLSPGSLDGDWMGHYVVPGEISRSLTLRNVRWDGNTVTGEIVHGTGRTAGGPGQFIGRTVGGVLHLRDGLGTELRLRLWSGDVLQGEIIVPGTGLPRRGTVSLTRIRK